jgi:hypothetical protein
MLPASIFWSASLRTVRLANSNSANLTQSDALIDRAKICVAGRAARAK